MARNALKHGLSLPISLVPEAEAASAELCQLLAGEDSSVDRLDLARRIAEAKIDLMRVRSARDATLPVIPKWETVPGDWGDFKRALLASVESPLDKALQKLMETRFKRYNKHEAHQPPEVPAQIVDLARFERYERRAFARLKSAIRDWTELER